MDLTNALSVAAKYIRRIATLTPNVQDKPSHSHGFGLIGFIILIPALLIGSAAAWYGYCEVQKAYWDQKIQEMCKQDGGITVYERVVLDKRYVDKDKNIRIPPKPIDSHRAPFAWEAKSDDLYFYESKLDVIKSGELTVGRTRITVDRKTDGKVLGEGVFYGRSGGDFPSIAFPSRFTCPLNQGETTLFKAIFVGAEINRGVGK